MMHAWKNFSQLFNIKNLKHLFHFSCKFKKSAYFELTFLFFNCVCNVIMTSREQQWRLKSTEKRWKSAENIILYMVMKMKENWKAEEELMTLRDWSIK